MFHDLAHAVFIISKISFSTKATVISRFSTTASFQLWPTVRNSIFPHFIMVIMCSGPSCGLWLCVGAP